MPEPQPRHLQARTEQDVLVLKIVDDHVHSDALADALREELLTAVGSGPGAKVALDFSNVEYLSSAGFRPLLSLRRRLHETGGRMVLCHLSPEVTNVFRITRLVSTSGSSTAPFEVEPDVAAAVARLNG
jgi:anti-anti-sigma factor